MLLGIGSSLLGLVLLIEAAALDKVCCNFLGQDGGRIEYLS